MINSLRYQQPSNTIARIVDKGTSGEGPRSPVTQGSDASRIGGSTIPSESSDYNSMCTTGVQVRGEEVTTKKVFSLNSTEKDRGSGSGAVKENCNISSTAMTNNKFLVLSDMFESGGIGSSSSQTNKVGDVKSDASTIITISGAFEKQISTNIAQTSGSGYGVVTFGVQSPEKGSHGEWIESRVGRKKDEPGITPKTK